MTYGPDGEATFERWQDLDALERHAHEWRALFARVPSATPFESPAWLIACARHVERAAPHVVAARRGGRLEAVLPLARARGGDALVALGRGPTDYHDLLVAPGAEPLAMSALLREAREHASITLTELRPGAAARRVLEGGEVDAAGVRVEAQPSSTCPVRPIDGDWLATIPSSLRRDVGYARRRFAREGGRFEIADARAIDEALSDLFRLHGARWRARGEPGVLADASVQALHREAAPALCADGMLRLHRMRRDDRTLAALLIFARGEVAYDYLSGFEPEARGLAPGTALIAAAIDEAIAHGQRRLDFLRGAEAYKYAWGAIDARSVTLVVRASDAGG
jgi:CelD/BcsL family acetyltransferase involved in cellulose biosynthesis